MESNNIAEPLGINPNNKDGPNILHSVDHDDGREILPENMLLRLSRNFGTMVSETGEDNSDDASRRFKSLLQAVLRTAKYACLSATHRASACNVLCGFLEHGVASSNLELRALCFSASTWNQVFDVFIERAEDAKYKPMRQVLVTLVKVLSKNPESNTVHSIRDAAVEKLLASILGQECLSFVRPAMQALQHLISKQVIDTSDLLSRIRQVRYAENAPTCIICVTDPTLHSGKCQDLRGPPLPVNVSCNVDPNLPGLPPRTSAIQDFIWSVLDCVRVNTDLAPAAGRLLSSFLIFLHRTTLERNQDSKKLDVWIRPVYGFMKQHPDLIELFAHHILRDLLRLGSSTSTGFLEILPLDDIERGFTGRLDVVDIHVFLIASKATEEYGLMPYACAFSSMESRVKNVHMQRRLQMADADHLEAPISDFSTRYVALVEALLLHTSPSIRLAALTFATRSKFTTELVSNHILSSLRQCLPQFHAEADAKSRNEFISIMKRLFTRLKGGLAQSSRSQLVSQSVQSAKVSRTSIKPVEESSDGEDPSHALIDCNVRFLKWYTVFLSGELLPTASYPRHITALKLLHLFIQLGLDTYSSTQNSTMEANGNTTREVPADRLNDRILRLLVDLLMNPFDDVRSMAASILKLGALEPASLCCNSKSHCPSSQYSGGGPRRSRGDAHLDLVELRRRAQGIMLRTGRADHADGAGRFDDLLYLIGDAHEGLHHVRKSRADMIKHLLSDLQTSIKIVKENLRMAVFKAPLHGHLIALRYIVSQPYFYKSLTDDGDVRHASWRTIHDSILRHCAEVWQAVKGVLCLDSPEGHTGEDFEEDDLDIGVKDTLSFSWRALKEASALQHAIVTNESYGPLDPALGLQHHDLQAIGRLAFTQLAELRHRGAFSTVSQTFAACCTRCIKTKNSKTVGLPQEWYQDALSCIHEKASALTRRSAGIPAMITGILVAHSSSCFLENVILDMQAISDTPVEAIPDAEIIQLPQVHAMNCLKDIFTNTQLGPRTEPYIADTLDIAAGCLESDIWAIQNCGLMLLKALLNRLIGKNEASSSRRSAIGHDTTTLLYDRYPNLPDLIVKLLQADAKVDEDTRELVHKSSSTLDIPQAQKVFPALEIIQRAGMPLKHRPTIKSLLLWHLESTVWYIRKKAAKTISIVTDASSFQNEVTELVQEPWLSQNTLHGRLLCVRELLLMASDTVDDIPSIIIESVLRLSRPIALQNQCPFTITAYMDIIGDLLRSPKLATKVGLNDKRRLLDVESKRWQTDPGYGESPLKRRNNLLSWDISRYSILAAHHRLDTVGSGDGEKSIAISNLARELARGDLDALHAVVTDFEDIIYQWTGQEIESIQIGISFLLSVLSEGPAQDVRAVAMSKLGSLLSSHRSRRASTLHTSIPRYGIKLKSLFDLTQVSVRSSPQLADGAIRLQGAVLSGLALNKFISFEDTYGGIGRGVESLKTFIRTLRLTGNECNEPHIRLAVAASLEGFQIALRPNADRADTRPEFLGIYLALYDMLNDDDLEIRERGASIVSWILSEPDPEPSSKAGSATLSLSPLAAKSRLSDLLIAYYNDSTALCYEAVGRLTGVGRDLGRSVLPHGMGNASSARGGHSKAGMRPMNLPDIRISLGEAKREDTALFVEEKQNLYIDDVQEADHWATIQAKLSPSSIDRDSALELEVWAMQGLAALTEMAEAEVDGPLGWTTKPEVFTVGARIIIAAGVILHWTSLGIASVTAGEVRDALEALYKAGEKNCLLNLWMQRIEDLLQESLLR